MPAIEFFPYFGPNRRSDRKLVEFRLRFQGDDLDDVPGRARRITEALQAAGRITHQDDWLPDALPADPRLAWGTLFAHLCLWLQRDAGQPVSEWAVQPLDENACLGWFEHEHQDVGMTGARLALTVAQGQRTDLAATLRSFATFATERTFPPETRHLLEAARERDIPAVPLERIPFARDEFDHLTGGVAVRRQGLLVLGHGRNRQVMDGSFCHTRLADRRPLLSDRAARRRLLRELGVAGSEPALAEAAVSEALGGAPVVARVADDGGMDFDPAPPLDRTGAERVLDWLFPPGVTARVRSISVTGTNGKTTTCRMAAHILRHAGHRTALVCTEGSDIDGETLFSGDQGTRHGHLRVLIRPDVDAAVLETHHGGILGQGFAFHRGEVAVGLNVSADHIGYANVESVEQMAEVKGSLMERASEAVVLYLGNAFSRGWADRVRARRLCWVSDDDQAPGDGPACLLETVDGVEWVMLRQSGESLPLLPVGDIPATLDGAARFNVTNAQHAAAAAWMFGIEPTVIAAALRAFHAGPDTTPGRLNEWPGLPFRLITDFAHNVDGVRRLVEFADRVETPGRKMIAMSVAGDRSDEILRGMVRHAAGHFDRYFCKDYPRWSKIPKRSTAGRIHDELLAAGVAAADTELLTAGKDVAFSIFDQCEPGDLLLYMAGKQEKASMAEWVAEYRSLRRQGAVPD